MSKDQTVDQRVVEMQFNNADFEGKIAATLEHLQKLREATKMEDAGEGMKNLARSVKDVDVNPLTKGVQALAYRFSALGIAGMTVIQDLTRAAERLASQLVDAVVTAPKDGWKEYELYTDSVKTILNSAKDANGLPVTLDMVNEKLAELNEYSDKTIYSFSDMTQNIGKFTNAGVDLESAVKAIQGVANVAALSGANAEEASRAMYNFGQALGSGSIKLVDWKSIENANMATVDFKQNLIDTALELGTIRREGDKFVSTTTDMSGKVSDAFNATLGFNDALSSQWMTAEVLTKTLEKYTDDTTDLGKKAMAAAQEVTTFSKMMDTIKESMGSGWMNIWQTIFGDFDEQKKLWTGIYKEIDNVIQSMFSFWIDKEKGVLTIWKNLGGRDDIVEAFSNLWGVAKKFIEPIQMLFSEIVPDVTGEGLADISKRFKESTEYLKELFGVVDEKAAEVGKTLETVKETVEDLTELAEAVIGGKYGNGDERKKKLEEEGYTYEKVQNKVNELLGVSFRYEVAEDKVTESVEANTEATKKNEEQLGSLEKAQDKLQKKQSPLQAFMATVSSAPWLHNNALDNATLFFAGIASSISVIKTAVSDLKIVEKITWAITKAFSFLSDVLGNVGRYLLLFNKYLLETRPWLKFVNAIKGGLIDVTKLVDKFRTYTGRFKNIGRLLKAISTGIENIRISFIELIKKLASGEKVGLSFKGLNKILDVLVSIGKFIGGGLLSAIDAALGLIFSVIDGTKSLSESLKGFGILETVYGWFTKVKAVIVDLVQNSKVGSFFESVGKTFEPLIKLVEDFFGKTKEEGPEAFSGMNEPLSEFGQEVQDAFAGFKEGGLIERAITLIDRLKNGLKDLPGLVSDAVDAILEKGSLEFLKVPQSIEEFTTQITNFASKIKGNAIDTISGMFIKLAEAFRGLKDNKFLGQFSKTWESFAKNMENLSKSVEPWTKSVGKFVNKVIKKLDGVTFKGVGLFMFLTAISYFAFKWASVGRIVAQSFNNLSEFILHGSKPFNKFKDKMKAFVLLALAVELLAGAVWIISKVPHDRFAECCAAIAGGLGLMVVAIIAVEKAVTNPQDLVGAAVAFIGLAAGLVILAKAVEMWAGLTDSITPAVQNMFPFIVGGILAIMAVGKMVTSVGAGLAFVGLATAILMLSKAIDYFKEIDWSEALKAAKNMGVFIAELTAAIFAVGFSKGTAGAGVAFVGLAFALWLLVPVIKTYAGLKTDTLISAAGAIGFFLLEMTAVIKLAGGANKGVGAAFLGVAVSLFVLAAAIKLYSTMKLYTLIKGGVAISVFLYALAGAVRLAGSARNVGAIIAISVALIPLAGALFVLSKIHWARLIVAAVALRLVLGGVAVALKALSDGTWWNLKDTLVRALSLGLVLAAVVAALVVLDKFTHTERMLDLAGSMALVLLAVTVPIAILKDTDWAGGARAAAAVGEFLGGLLLVFGAIGEVVSFLSSLNGMSEEDGWEWLSNQAAALGDVLHSFWSALLNGKNGKTVEEVKEQTEQLEPVAQKMVSFAELMKEFFDITKNMTDDDAKRADIMATAILKLGVAQLVDAIANIITGSPNYAKFGEGLKGLAGAFIEMHNMIKDQAINPEDFTPMIESVEKFVELAEAIPETGGWEQKLTGTHDLGAFAASMYEFINGNFAEGTLGFEDFLSSVKDLDITDSDLERVEMIKKAALKMSQVAQDIPETASIFAKITGVKDLGEFAAGMSDFLSGKTENGEHKGGFKAFLTSLRGLTINQGDLSRLTDYVVPATETMVDLAKTIKNNQSVLEFFTGAGGDLSEFGGAMKTFGADVLGFVNFMKGVAVTRLDALAASIKGFILLNGMEEIKIIYLTAFSSSLALLGNEFRSFYETTSSVDLERVTEILTQLTAVKDFLLGVNGVEFSSESFSNAMANLATTSVDGFATALANSTDSATAAIKEYVVQCIAALDGYDDAFINTGVRYVSQVYTQFNSETSLSNAWNAFKNMLEYVMRTATTRINDNENGFAKVGRQALVAFRSGVKDSWGVGLVGADVREVLVEKPVAYVEDWEKRNKKFYHLGEFCATGFADGLLAKAEDAVAAAKELAKQAQDALASANQSNSPSKVYMRLGTYAVDGYALGFTNSIGTAVRAVTEMGNAGIYAMRDSIERMNDMIDDNVDYQPTITPVMDLDLLASGMRTTRGLLSDLNTAGVGVQAAFDIANAHNAELARAKAIENRDYSTDLNTLIANTRSLIDEAKKNKPAVIDGDYLFGYVDRRMGMA